MLKPYEVSIGNYIYLVNTKGSTLKVVDADILGILERYTKNPRAYTCNSLDIICEFSYDLIKPSEQMFKDMGFEIRRNDCNWYWLQHMDYPNFRIREQGGKWYYRWGQYFEGNEFKSIHWLQNMFYLEYGKRLTLPKNKQKLYNLKK